MDKMTVRKHKWFFSWQDEERETWLGEMSRQGLHLKETAPFGGFLFTQGPAREYSYRLDYNRNKLPEDYIQLIRDGGWEYLGKRAGWHYWRKEVTDGQTPELFTDPDSKIQKYKRVIAGYITSAPALYIVGLAMFNRYPGRHPLWFVILFISLFMAWIVFAAVNAVMIWKRINGLKQAKSI